MVRATTIYAGEATIAEIDARRQSTTSRSEWVQEAIHARLEAEDDGGWTDPDKRYEDGEQEATAP